MEHFERAATSYLIMIGAGCVLSRAIWGLDDASNWFPAVNVIAFIWSIVRGVISFMAARESQA